MQISDLQTDELFSFYNDIFWRCILIQAYYIVVVLLAVHFRNEYAYISASWGERG